MVELLVGAVFLVGTLVFALMVILSAAGEALGTAAVRAASAMNPASSADSQLAEGWPWLGLRRAARLELSPAEDERGASRGRSRVPHGSPVALPARMC